jgi:SRSO17 transposase
MKRVVITGMGLVTALGHLLDRAKWDCDKMRDELRAYVRSWQGWHRHVTLSMLALAFLTALRVNGEKDVLKKA